MKTSWEKGRFRALVGLRERPGAGDSGHRFHKSDPVSFCFDRVALPSIHPGVLNLHALKSVVDFGKLPFAVFDSANDETTNSPQLVQNWMELPVNINVMIVGTTRSGIFPVECVVPVVAERGIEGALEELRIGGEKEDKVLEDMRLYLGIMREGSYNVPEEMVKVRSWWAWSNIYSLFEG